MLVNERAGVILNGVIRLKGWDPETFTVSGADRETLTEAANDLLREAWSRQKWPLLMRTEQRQYRPTWAVGTTYAMDEEVWHAGTETYWKSLAAGNVGHEPAEGSAFWEKPDDFIPFIQLAQPWETWEIWERGVDLQAFAFDSDPRLTPNIKAIKPCEFWMDSVVLPSSAPVKPWVRFMPRCPELSFTEWSGATAYAAGEACYLTSTGRSYTALQGSTNKSPATETDYWVEVGVPKFMSRYVRIGMLAAWRTADEGRYQTQAEARAELERMEQEAFERAGQAQGVRWGGVGRRT